MNQMSEDELSSSVPVVQEMTSTSLEDVELSTDDQVTLKECCRECFRPLCQVRRVKSKGAILVIIWTFLTAGVSYLGINYLSEIVNGWTFAILYSIMGISLPITGFLADVRFGRYKFISCGLWMMWISSILLTAASVVEEFIIIKYENILNIGLIFFMGIGWACYQANIIQFGIDQLIDASVSQYKTFVVWFIFATMGYQLVMYCTLQCVKYHQLPLLLACCGVTIAISLNFLFAHVLIKEPTTHNPFQLVYKVIHYAIKHKHPRQRSAFTYCEDELPSRIDFGKSKYGGPFTTEQVEDVKTLIRIIMVLMIACAIFCINNERHFITSKVRSSFQPINKCSSDFVISGFYFICGSFLIPLHELLLHPLFGRILPPLKSCSKFIIGALLRVSRVVVLIIMVTISRHNYLENNFSNSTLPCLFQENYRLLDPYIDYRWTLIPEFLCAASDVMIYVAALEFLCAQVPYSMKGLMVGFTYTFLAFFIPTFDAIQKIFELKQLSWGTGVISCGFWYFITKLSLQLISFIIIFGITFKCYKERKREDVLPNDHIFAERYYSY